MPVGRVVEGAPVAGLAVDLGERKWVDTKLGRPSENEKGGERGSVTYSVGAGVGRAVGADVGKRVGRSVGSLVVGDLVGTSVTGAAVAPVGESVGGTRQ